MDEAIAAADRVLKPLADALFEAVLAYRQGLLEYEELQAAYDAAEQPIEDFDNLVKVTEGGTE